MSNARWQALDRPSMLLQQSGVVRWPEAFRGVMIIPRGGVEGRLGEEEVCMGRGAVTLRGGGPPIDGGEVSM